VFALDGGERMQSDQSNPIHPPGSRNGSGGYLARYEELRRDGRMPGLSLSRARLLLDEPPSLSDEDPLLRSAALAFGIATGNRAGVCNGFPYDEFWSLSLASAVAAQALGRELGAGRPEAGFLSGFLHRLGALAFACAFPEDYASIVASCPVSSFDELLGIERERFGMDHLQLTHAILEDLGFDRSVREVARGLASGRPAAGGVLGDLMGAAERIANLCILGEDARQERWLDLIELRRDLEMERDVFSELGDGVIRGWWDWGDHLRIRTRPLPSFYALDHTAIHDRRTLGIAEKRVESSTDHVLRVLVVDDDPTALLLLRAQLERGGHRVYTASNGTEALAFAQQLTPDVVVADWEMPGMDGLELCRVLRRFEAGRHVYFVLLTGREEDEHVIAAFDAGVDDFVTKPSREGLLLARMKAARRVLDLRAQVRLDERLLKRQVMENITLARHSKEAAVTDPLTELPNRRYATRRLNEEWASSERNGSDLSLVMLDVDHFKRVNDNHGHEVGDDVLRALADVLERTTRQNEVACRFGGEEFVVICSSTGERGARACGERIRRAIEEQVAAAVGFDEPVTASVGVATRRAGTASVEDLVRQADQAVYRAKERGRNRTCYDDPAAALPAAAGPAPPRAARPNSANGSGEASPASEGNPRLEPPRE
jgi:diguanylate cyclase (GGDEF)-like protein